MTGADPTTGIALAGCGFAADFYLATLGNHPELRILGVFDRDPQRAAAFAAHHDLRRYADLDALLGDARVQQVVNLTSPESHYEVSRAALLADKHVYSEKPLATAYADAEELVLLAERRQLVLSCAPCNLLGESLQTLWRAVRKGDIGVPQLVYAELDDGALHRMPYTTWRSASGAAWPYRSEFRLGCTLEHAGYHLSWLTAMFGAATEIHPFSTNAVASVPEVDERGPDFSATCLRFSTGVVARLTCSVVAPPDHSIRIIGEEGVLQTADAWHYGSPVKIRRARPRGTPGHLALPDPEPYPLVRPCDFPHRYEGFHLMDFCRGVAEVARAAAEQRPSRLSARHSLHALELMLAMSSGHQRSFETRLDPVPPMEWAEDWSDRPARSGGKRNDSDLTAT